MLKEKKILGLFQDYCSHHENIYNLSPLTAQIYTYIMFNSGDGVTFDEITCKLNASKSSVSSSLNLLISNGQVEFFYKIDERKRYFKLNPNYLSIRLTVIRDALEREKMLGMKMLEYMDEGVIKSNNCEKKINLYIEHLEKSTENLSEIISKLKNQN